MKKKKECKNENNKNVINAIFVYFDKNANK